MAEKHSSPDRFARLVAAIGIFLSVGGMVVSILSLRLSYSNSRWQSEIQEESTAERILVHLDASRTVNNILSNEPLSLDPKGEVGMEIVNIGLRPLFIKRAEMRIHDRVFTFYEHDPFPPPPNNDHAKTNEPIKMLEPSEATRYRLSWDFTEHPIQEYWGIWSAKSQNEDIEVQVQTTKRTFVFQHQIMNRTAFVADIAEARKKASKQASPDH